MTREQISKIVSTAVKSQFDIELMPTVDYAEAQFGDFATNAAFQLAGQLKRSPGEIAAELAGAIKDPVVASAAAAGGYINLKLADDVWLGELDKINSKYGASQHGKAQKVQVEFVSANPTGPLTLGNARGGFIGDVLARVLGHSGYDVTREYYFNDAGSQIVKLVESIKSAAGLVHPKEIQYKGDYIEELAKKFRKQLESKDDAELGRLITQDIFERFIKPATDKMGISFDVWFNERDLGGQAFNEALDRLKRAGLYEEKDGATWAKTTKLGDERDRPIIKTGGDVTYLGNDIAYHLNIFEERGFDRAIKLWGADHAGQVPSLRLIMQKLCPDKKLDFLIMQFVRLMRDGQEVKMSKRAGTYVTTDELIDEVGADVARFFFLMRSADSHMDFDLDLAKEESQKNPYWYVMYAYVRANSILQQASDKSLKPATASKKLSPEAQTLTKQMTQLPELIAEMAEDYGVHRLTFFGIEVAKLWHDYYESRHILSLEAKEAEAELYFVQQFKEFMEVYFELLGIKPISKM